MMALFCVPGRPKMFELEWHLSWLTSNNLAFQLVRMHRHDKLDD